MSVVVGARYKSEIKGPQEGDRTCPLLPMAPEGWGRQGMQSSCYESQMPSCRATGWRWERDSWNKDKRNFVESRTWLTPVLRKERTCEELQRAGRKPSALFQPGLLLSAQGLTSHDRLSLCKTEYRCSGAMIRGQGSRLQGGSALRPEF